MTIIEVAKKEDSKDLAKLMMSSAAADTYGIALSKIVSYRLYDDKELFVAKRDTKVRGFGGIRNNSDSKFVREFDFEKYFYLDCLGANPIKQGLGSQLVNVCLDWAEEKDSEGVWLICEPKNVRFYEKLGFTSIHFYIVCRQDRYVMKRSFA